MNSSLTTLQVQEKTIHLLGTAHVSQASAQEVKEYIKQLRPESVCVELDQDRFDSIQSPNRWEDTDIIEVIKQKKTGYMLANLILSSYQRRLAKKMDIAPGQEMIQGIQSAKESSANLVLADRKISTTFSRIYRKLSFKEKMKLLYLLISSIFDEEEISEDDIEQLKQSDILEASLTAISKDFPIVSQVLVHERDQTLAYHIKNAPGKVVFAVLGAAHVPGVSKELFLEQDIQELTSVPPKKKTSQLIGWLIPIFIVIMILSLFTVDSSIGLQQIIRWTLVNGSLSAFGTLLAGGHILSILTAFIAAPITSLNPLLAAGWFAGITEAFIRKPKVKDFKNIADDLSTFSGFYKNRVTHILLVVVLANLFSSLGTFLGGIDLINTFIQSFF
ncbi:MAG: TraB/GumN family protein [Anaerorhabdus sp.]